MSSGPLYDRALKALNDAYSACYEVWEKNPNRDPIGMSRGPFSGVNEVLGIVFQLETELMLRREK